MKKPVAVSVKSDDPLNLDYSEDNGIWLTNGYSLRKLIGILGMALPLLLWLNLLLVSDQTVPLASISHYYFTRAGSIFTIIVSLLAIFLIVYKGEEPVDFYISLTAGVFALCVLLFPTSNLCTEIAAGTRGACVTFINQNRVRETFHYVAAGIFLLSLAYTSFFLFTKSDKSVINRGKMKITRNRIYRTCGTIIFLSILIIVVAKVFSAFFWSFINPNQLTFWMETIAVEAFGFSWLVKGEAIFGDKMP